VLPPSRCDEGTFLLLDESADLDCDSRGPERGGDDVFPQGSIQEEDWRIRRLQAGVRTGRPLRHPAVATSYQSMGPGCSAGKWWRRQESNPRLP